SGSIPPRAAAARRGSACRGLARAWPALAPESVARGRPWSAGQATTASPACHDGGRRDLTELGTPIVGSALAALAIGALDTAMMGRYSVAGLAAVGVGAAVFALAA